MNNLAFACGLGALALVTITFLVLIKRILAASGKDGAMIARVIAVVLGVAVGGVILPNFLPLGATTGALYARLIDARESIFLQGMNFASLTLVGFVSTYFLYQLGLTRERERSRDYLLVIVSLITTFLLRILVETLFRYRPGQPGFLWLQTLPIVACSVGCLLALMHIYSSDQSNNGPDELRNRFDTGAADPDQ